jgi:TolA-binding protein
VVSDPRWQAARKAELDGDWAEAATRYRDLVASSRDLAEDALFAWGRMERRQGHASEALVQFRKYRAAYPSGAYVRAADLHVLELLVETGNKEAALTEATRFLEAYPNDARAWKFRQTRSSLLAERGDCAGALAAVKNLPRSDATTAIEKRCSAGEPR